MAAQEVPSVTRIHPFTRQYTHFRKIIKLEEVIPLIKEKNHVTWQESGRAGKKNCPFCLGNEQLTPPEIMCFRDNRITYRNGRGPWQTRVIPDKYPIFCVESPLKSWATGIYDNISVPGANEVIIETSEHGRRWTELTAAEGILIFKTIRERIKDLKKDPRLVNFFVFENFNLEPEAHLHSQLLALPARMVPEKLGKDVTGAEIFYLLKTRCLLCAILQQEMEYQEHILIEKDSIIAFLPYFGPTPFEIWITPKKHVPYFEVITDGEIRELAEIFIAVLQKLENLLGPLAFTARYFSAPSQWPRLKQPQSLSDYYHWRIEILPDLPFRREYFEGFVKGTGDGLNYVFPEEAIKAIGHIY